MRQAGRSCLAGDAIFLLQHCDLVYAGTEGAHSLGVTVDRRKTAARDRRVICSKQSLGKASQREYAAWFRGSFSDALRRTTQIACGFGATRSEFSRRHILQQGLEGVSRGSVCDARLDHVTRMNGESRVGLLNIRVKFVPRLIGRGGRSLETETSCARLLNCE